MSHAHPANAATVQVNCQRCKQPFTARVADRNRGWGKFCSKSCKAIKQTQQTGWSGPGSGPRPGHAKAQPRAAYEGYVHWDDDTHPFSSDALGQW